METFNFLEYAAGTNYPEDTVKIYLDVDAAYKLGKIEKEISRTVDADELKKLETEAEKLRERFENSRSEVFMRGIPVKDQKKAEKASDEKFGAEKSKEKDIWFSRELLARHIVKVVNASGAEDTSVWDAEKIEQLENLITDESTNRLVNKVKELSFRTDIFENVEVNPDF